MQTFILTFPFRIPPYELSAFRGAVNELVDPAVEYFHNHDNSSGKPHFHWDYPKIRYSLFQGRAAITSIGEGVSALMQHLLPRLLEVQYLQIGGNAYPVAGFQCRQKQLELQLLDRPKRFGLHRWVALNKANYRKWKQLEGKADARLMLLQRALTGHLRTMAESLAPELDRQQIVADIIRVDQQKRIKWHQTQLVGFNVVAESRFVPSVGLGVGRSVAFGFGEVLPAEVYHRLLQVHHTTGDREEVL